MGSRDPIFYQDLHSLVQVSILVGKPSVVARDSGLRQ